MHTEYKQGYVERDKNLRARNKILPPPPPIPALKASSQAGKSGGIILKKRTLSVNVFSAKVLIKDTTFKSSKGGETAEQRQYLPFSERKRP